MKKFFIVDSMTISPQIIYYHLRNLASYQQQALRAVTSAATFLVAPGQAPLVFKIDSTATSAASILTTFKHCVNR